MILKVSKLKDFYAKIFQLGNFSFATPVRESSKHEMTTGGTLTPNYVCVTKQKSGKNSLSALQKLDDLDLCCYQCAVIVAMGSAWAVQVAVD